MLRPPLALDLLRHFWVVETAKKRLTIKGGNEKGELKSQEADYEQDILDRGDDGPSRHHRGGVRSDRRAKMITSMDSEPMMARKVNRWWIVPAI